MSDHPLVGEIRGRGLLAGIQLVVDKKTRQLPDPAAKWAPKVAAQARELGLIIRPLPSVSTLAVSPPLIISVDQIDYLVESIVKSLEVLE
nr:aminotransferase class III-fold pyridoxal phosphate-dependent enzyme [Oceanicoccus sp. KOV_DT_Chl]